MNPSSIPSSIPSSVRAPSRSFALLSFTLLCAVGLGCGEQLVELPLDGDSGGSGGSGGTGDEPDAGTGPTVIATSPLDAATERSLGQRPTATFSRAMEPSSINAVTFAVRQGATPVAGAVSYSGSVATFTPSRALDVGLVYTATISTGARDPSGAALAAPYVWSFTTGACSLLGVELGRASDFAVLAGSTVTNTGGTSITGDLGVSPGSAVTGFPPGVFVGTMHAGNAAAANAIADLTTAYNDAAGRVLCAVSVAGDLGGRTLTPGLYKSTSSLEITSGNLTLDARGDPDAVFILQTASTLTTASASQVILAGGAQAKNITWQIGTSASLGTTSSFHGAILADQAISLATGAALRGRALARIAVVSLDGNTVEHPGR
jgi:Ice-binding-like/Bacterial Ig-like domain